MDLFSSVYLLYLVNAIYALITPRFLAWVSLLNVSTVYLVRLFAYLIDISNLTVQKCSPPREFFLILVNGNPILHLFRPKLLVFCDLLLSLTNHILCLSKCCSLGLQDLSNNLTTSHHCHHSHPCPNHHQIASG